MSDCVKRFHSCSLQLLKNANIEDKSVEGIVVEPVAPADGDKNKKLSSSLFSCIQVSIFIKTFFSFVIPGRGSVCLQQVLITSGLYYKSLTIVI